MQREQRLNRMPYLYSIRYILSIADLWLGSEKVATDPDENSIVLQSGWSPPD